MHYESKESLRKSIATTHQETLDHLELCILPVAITIKINCPALGPADGNEFHTFTVG